MAIESDRTLQDLTGIELCQADPLPKDNTKGMKLLPCPAIEVQFGGQQCQGIRRLRSQVSFKQTLPAEMAEVTVLPHIFEYTEFSILYQISRDQPNALFCKLLYLRAALGASRSCLAPLERDFRFLK